MLPDIRELPSVGSRILNLLVGRPPPRRSALEAPEFLSCPGRGLRSDRDRPLAASATPIYLKIKIRAAGRQATKMPVVISATVQIAVA